MVRQPGVEVSAERAATWSAEGPLSGRALAFARRVVEEATRERPDAAGAPLRLRVVSVSAEHAGLGSGTQLGLAVARVVTTAWGIEAGVEALARWSGRGLRSALGVHGFERGGLLVEAGKRSVHGLAPLAARTDFPSQWRVVLVVPAAPRGGAAGLHGPDERETFARLQQAPADLARTDALCRLALLGLLPAAAEHDLEGFGEALYDFNRRSGEMFAPAQGGLYAGSAVEEMVAFVRARGIRGVGQSSWGPTVFAVAGEEEQAEELARELRGHFGLNPAEVLITEACNQGAVVPPPAVH
jgi:beta-ribofuranosylaminobenzene 5'-phosphate synthase